MEVLGRLSASRAVSFIFPLFFITNSVVVVVAFAVAVTVAVALYMLCVRASECDCVFWWETALSECVRVCESRFSVRSLKPFVCPILERNEKTNEFLDICSITLHINAMCTSRHSLYVLFWAFIYQILYCVLSAYNSSVCSLSSFFFSNKISFIFIPYSFYQKL